MAEHRFFIAACYSKTARFRPFVFVITFFLVSSVACRLGAELSDTVACSE